MVTFGENNKGRNKGSGSIQCKTIDFKDVSYVSGLRHNLISIRQLCETSYKVFLSKEEGNITYSKNLNLLTSIRKYNIYVLNVFAALLTFIALYF